MNGTTSEATSVITNDHNKRYLLTATSRTMSHSLVLEMASERKNECEQELRSTISAIQEMLAPMHSKIQDVSFPTFDGPIQISSDSAQLESAVDSLVNSISRTRKYQGKIGQKVKEISVKWLRSSYYFAKLFLGVAEVGSAVCFTNRRNTFTNW